MKFEMTKNYHPEFCAIARDFLDPDCSECTEETQDELHDEWRDITLTGYYTEEHVNGQPQGMFLEYTCNRCGRTDVCGDGDFHIYYDVDVKNMSIERREN